MQKNRFSKKMNQDEALRKQAMILNDSIIKNDITMEEIVKEVRMVRNENISSLRITTLNDFNNEIN